MLDLQGQLAPSGVLDGVLPSGQQPNSVLSQDDLSSSVGKVVLAIVGPEGDTQRLIIVHDYSLRYSLCRKPRTELQFLGTQHQQWFQGQKPTIPTFSRVYTHLCVCFRVLTSDWTLIKASVRSDYVAFSLELIVHLDLFLSGREHLMGSVASHLTHGSLLMMGGCDNCSLQIGWVLPSRSPRRTKTTYTCVCVTVTAYLAILGHYRHKSGSACSIWRMSVYITAASFGPL